MKKFFITILCAILMGSIFAFYMFQNIEPSIAKTVDNNTVTAFQVGVYSNYDNANTATKQYKSSLIYHDENYYRIFIALYHDESIIKLMQDYFHDTDVYLKEIPVPEEFLTVLSKYESLIKSSNIDDYDEVNQSVLNEFERIRK